MNTTINRIEEVEIDMEEMLERVEMCINKRNQTVIYMITNSSNTRTNKVITTNIQIGDKRENMIINMRRNSKNKKLVILNIRRKTLTKCKKVLQR